MKPARPLLLAVALFTWIAGSLAAPARAEFSASNLTEGRAGHDPARADLPENGTDIYERLDLEYFQSAFRLGGRFETHRRSLEPPDSPGYEKVTQRYAEWSEERFRLRAGNFYTIVGRGLLHRSFELQGVILEQPGNPSRYTPARDLDGVIAEGSAGPVAVRLFSGRPNDGTQSPAVEKLGQEIHRGLLSGAQATLRTWREAKLGAAYERFSSGSGLEDEYATGFLDLDPLRIAGVDEVQMPVYVEYARKRPSWEDWWSLNAEGSRDTAAFYAGSNVLWGNFGLSAEWKNYREFRLGFNDPPSLVREHSFYLLNRNTHFLLADREKGFQLEGSYALPAWGSLTLNLSRSDGDIGSTRVPRPVRFDERYAEIHLAAERWSQWEGTVFYQRGKDEFVGLFDRSVVGASATLKLLEHFAATTDLQRLEGTQTSCFLPGRLDFTDHYAALTLARAEWGSGSITWERTTDCTNEAIEDQNDLVVDPNTFVAGVVNARIGDRHQATLFVGERRGGLACTAGTCYIVQPFKGVELRLTSRF